MQPMTLAELAESQGIELLPWQQEFVDAIDRGESPIIQRPKRESKATLFRLVGQWEEHLKEPNDD